MDILKHIEELRDERGWSNYRLSEEAKLDNSVINNMFKRRTMPSMTTLAALCEAFDLTLSQFFNEDETAFILSDDEKDLITQYRKLDKKNKNAVYTLVNKLNN
ncbi:MAG: helix-turn-helix domain-containing protein [Christensenellales bacterium]